MTDDEREAEIIISRWIHKKTGVSELERGMRKIGDAFRKIGEALDPMADVLENFTKEFTLDKGDEEYGVVG